VEVNGIGEYERVFGPVSSAYPMSLAVADFFQNGGSRALVVRLFKAAPGSDGFATVTIDDLTLKASSQGTWGNALKVVLTLADNANPQVVELRKRLGIDQDARLFDLQVTETRPGGKIEQLRSLTLVPSVRRLDQVLLTESKLLRWEVPATLPKEIAVAKARTDLETEKNKPQPDPVKITQLEADLKAAIEARDQAPTGQGQNGADSADLDADAYKGSRGDKTGFYALEKADLFNLLCIPPDKREESTPDEVYQKALTYCVERRAMLIVDPKAAWSTPRDQAVDNARKGPAGMGLTGPEARNAALYFPRILQSDAAAGGEIKTAVPCGVIAGVMARTDVQRGVWKAPAGSGCEPERHRRAGAEPDG
jgi:phage tail sheath protein FI